VFIIEDMTNLPGDIPRTTSSEFTELVIDECDVYKLLCDLKPNNKSPGPDKLHLFVLKECAAELAAPLCILFKCSLEEGVLPQMWKDGHISAIFKKGSRCRASNYRPISLTSVVCKLMERLVRNALMQHLLGNGLLSETQHGFVP